MNKPKIRKVSMNKLVKHCNKRFEKNYETITAWEWYNAETGIITVYFDGGETEADPNNFARKKSLDIFMDKNFPVFQELNELVGYC